MEKKQDRKIIDVREISTYNQEYVIPSSARYGVKNWPKEDHRHLLSQYKIEFDKDWIVTVDIPVNKEKSEYHRLIIKQVKGKNEVCNNNTVTIHKVYRLPEMANWILEGYCLENYLNFGDAITLIRFALYKWLLKQPEEIIIRPADKKHSKVTIKTKDVLKTLVKDHETNSKFLF